MINAPQKQLFFELSLQEQREQIQEDNPDMLAGVFSKIGESPIGLRLITLENVLACYPNQLYDGQIKLPDDFGKGEIVIVDMGALRKGELKVIAGNENKLPKVENPVLLSPGVIEYWENETSGKKYTQTVLRDGGKMNASEGIISLADANQRSTTAGRNFSGDLFGDLEIENAEESPFLMKDSQGTYFLVTHNLTYKQKLIESIESFLEKKYLSENDENFDEVKSAFERKFKEVKYVELGNILQGIIKNDCFQEYTWEEGVIEELDNTQIQLGEQTGNFYVFHDRENNTIEYRSVRRITGFPEGLEAVGIIPLRLFLESQNQDPQFRNIKNIGVGGVGLVPTMEDVSKKVSTTINI